MNMDKYVIRMAQEKIKPEYWKYMRMPETLWQPMVIQINGK